MLFFVVIWFVFGLIAATISDYYDKEFSEYLNYKCPTVARPYKREPFFIFFLIVCFLGGPLGLAGTTIGLPISVRRTCPDYSTVLKNGRKGT